MTQANSAALPDIQLHVEGMSCNGCAQIVKQILAGQPGVAAVEVSFAEKRAVVAGDAGIDIDSLVDALVQQDFAASPL